MNENFDLDAYIFHHISDAPEWHIPFFTTIELPHFLSLHGVMLWVAALILIIMFCFLYNKNTQIPTGFTNFLEVFVLFVRNQIAIAHLGKEDGRKMTSFFCTFFFFILTLNLIALIPGFSTATANINVTCALALITLTFMVGGAFYKNGWRGFIKAVTPSGVPIPILFLLVPIEILGLFIKSFALMIRLFANMLAGHVVIISLLGIVVLIGVAASPAIILAVFISILEIFVAFLQAYVFTLLSAIFIGQMLHPEH